MRDEPGYCDRSSGAVPLQDVAGASRGHGCRAPAATPTRAIDRTNVMTEYVLTLHTTRTEVDRD